MKNKKTMLIISIVALAFVLISGIAFFLIKEDKNSSLNILEKQWIEKNKNNVIDISIVNNTPIFNYEGEGVFLDYIDSLEDNTGLSFNRLAYQNGSSAKSDYAFKIVNELGKKDIEFYQDYYVLLTKKDVKYLDLREIDLKVIGVHKDKVEAATKYLNTSAIKSYDSYDKLFEDLKDDEIDAIVVPNIIYLKEIISDDNINLAFTITDIKDKFALSLGDNDKLNTILKKYFSRWSNNELKKSFDKHLSSNYFNFLNMEETDKAKFRSKRYTYGFVKNTPFDYISSGKLTGINNEILANFSLVSGSEINYKEYKSLESLLNAFNKNEIDFFFATNSDIDYAMDIYKTDPIVESKVVILSDLKNDTIINSVNSLDSEVGVIKNSKIAKYLTDNKVKIKGYNNIEELIKNKNKTKYIAIDQKSYNYYSHNTLLKYKVDYLVDINADYGFIARDIKDNEAFIKYFDYYLSTINIKKFENAINKTLLVVKNNQTLYTTLIGLLAIAIVTLGGFIYKKLFSKKKTIVINKNDKIKYIDMLTSLKNRTYLNDNIEKWDDSEVYPQTIVIVDLNNVAYINDNYGHEEGDKIIKEAANILIKNQISSTEIMRTNGNEFLIYMVGYDEKQVISYTRKLNKEFKELAHGFGAAIGYSMINDAIKTIDDAVNEATLDMRNNKEELNN